MTAGSQRTENRYGDAYCAAEALLSGAGQGEASRRSWRCLT